MTAPPPDSQVGDSRGTSYVAAPARRLRALPAGRGSSSSRPAVLRRSPRRRPAARWASVACSLSGMRSWPIAIREDWCEPMRCMTAPLEACASSNSRAFSPGRGSGQLLADLGADVVKVERPGAGDDTRDWGPPFVEGADGEPALGRLFPVLQPRQALDRGRFRDARRGRRSCAGSPRHADVLIENFKVGGLAKYGLDYASLARGQSAPRLLLDHGLRPDGPLRAARRLRLHDPGHGRHHGPDRRAGRRAAEGGVAFADIFTGVYAAVGDPGGAAPARCDGRRAAIIDMALLDTQVGVLATRR